MLYMNGCKGVAHICFSYQRRYQNQDTYLDKDTQYTVFPSPTHNHDNLLNSLSVIIQGLPKHRYDMAEAVITKTLSGAMYGFTGLKCS